jgi:hypothetical protein
LTCWRGETYSETALGAVCDSRLNTKYIV